MSTITHSVTKSVSLAVVNHQLQDSISVLDRGLAYGDGVFETMSVGRQNSCDIVLWQYHYDRLMDGLKRLHIKLNVEDLSRHMDVTLTEIKARQSCFETGGVLKLMVTRGEGGEGYVPAEEATPTLITLFYPLSANYLQYNMDCQQRGVHVHYCEQKLASHFAIAGIKSLNQLPYVLASRERQQQPCLQEGLLFSRSNQLIEATARNVFIVKDNEIYTPKLNVCGVAGVMRRLIIDHIQQLAGFPVHQIHLTKKNLLLADEVFLTNSISGVWPVIHCENNTWPIGQVTRKVQQVIDAFLQKNRTLSLSHFSFM